MAAMYEHVRVRDDAMDRARRLARKLNDDDQDSIGRRRPPTCATVLREAIERGLALLERELDGVPA
jgi:hypothetical protein